MNVENDSVGWHAAWFRPLPLKQGLPNDTSSCVQPTRSVFTRVLPSTEFSEVTTV